ncbi:orotidine-5'-phosphate decarboxylase [Periweissella cryptocerci]|uniref:Orotidine 5'-phosphate decarboxylase n=1 Tax=Periweissella cryptocerci TaxID=2506420 RepID=A0A4P6YVI3_9LACO|nr:orotidine-5'-phosphate decarboxylase [Periweissella cryptocerci]QBO36800.1 orotidine-5'-phosphate decarboxylase [Periweissella cryptocerci]
MKPVIIALDFENEQQAFAFLSKLDMPEKPYVKVGMELFYSAGPAFVRELKAQGFKIFLDVKMYDIPNTVEHAAYQIGQLGVDIVTVHAAGGARMIAGAKKGLLAGAKAAGFAQPTLLAITQLTSFSEAEMQVTQLVSVSMTTSVLYLAKLAQAAGADGVIASAYEARKIHEATSPDFLVITPGIRLTGDDAGDQSRIMTPAQAALETADGIVVGRSITKATDVHVAYKRVLTEFNGEK